MAVAENCSDLQTKLPQNGLPQWYSDIYITFMKLAPNYYVVGSNKILIILMKSVKSFPLQNLYPL